MKTVGAITIAVIEWVSISCVAPYNGVFFLLDHMLQHRTQHDDSLAGIIFAVWLDHGFGSILECFIII